MKMRKLSVLLILAAVITTFTAEAKIPGLSYGPKVGVNFNHFSTNIDDYNSENRCGFTIGATAEYIAPAIGLGLDISLMYSYMQNEMDTEAPNPLDPNNPLVTTQKMHGSFFEIPLHIKYKLTVPAISKIVKPYVFTGPSVAFLLSGPDNYFSTKRTQWGWDFGLGLDLFKRLQIGAGYTFGINNVADNLYKEGEVVSDIKVKNNYWTVTACWMF